MRRVIAVLVAAMALLLAPLPASADTWYEHYFKAEQALGEEDWARAVKEINEALEKKGDSGARVRSYGMNVIAYYPYLKLGIAYYHLDQFAAALQAFETEARLGAIAQSDDALEELERYRRLSLDAQQAAAAAEQERIRIIVADSLGRAKVMEDQGLLGEAMAALDQALAVAPDDADARAAMHELRPRFAAWQREQEIDEQVTRLVEDARDLVDRGQFSAAASLLRQALFLKPDAGVQRLFDAAQLGLLAEIEEAPDGEAVRTDIAVSLDEVRRLESAGRFRAALERLQSIIAVMPSNVEALSIQRRLLQAQQAAETERVRRATIERLLAEAGKQLDAGSAEASLSPANRVLALDPANATALSYIARAYGAISQRLLGSVPRGNIPPAIRFVDLRREDDEGRLVQTVTSPEFLLSGVIIDDSTVEVDFDGAQDDDFDTRLDSQPLGDFYLTEFNVEARLSPGITTIRLVATDSLQLSSSSEYAVVYVRPVFRSPGFLASLAGIGLLLGGTLVWRRYRRYRQLRKRRFNPYVAGAPILEEDMFFGRAALIDRILQTIHNNSLLIYGERRIGKTSIQHQVKKRLGELDDPVYEFHPVFIDLQGTPESRFFQTIAEDIFQELAPHLGGLAPGKDLSEDYSYRDFVRDLHAILKVLRSRTSKKVKLVLLIDEVDVLNDYDPAINQKLRSLFMKSLAENLAAVVSGVEIKKRWERQGSPWYNFFEEIEVAPLETYDGLELIRRPIRGIFKLDRGVAEKILAITGGKPYLIQKICISLVTRLYEQHRRRITLADVEAVALSKAS
ncbi:MAG: ATP-binding protein [Gammaproteobacteria bacterium]|nr:ATP-binding protein [Gammaproteobacteria bacterium]MDH5304592.1 ATP-binding protein [Gammaproteobacteria bacterium]